MAGGRGRRSSVLEVVDALRVIGEDLAAGVSRGGCAQDSTVDQLAQSIGERLAVGGGGNKKDLRIPARVAGVEQLAGRAQTERLAHRAAALETGERNRQREVHVDIGKDRAEIGRLAMVGIAMKQRDAKASIGGVDQERPQAEGRGFGKILVRIAEAAVDLEWDIELAAFLRRLEQEGVAEGAAGKTQVFAALRA